VGVKAEIREVESEGLGNASINEYEANQTFVDDSLIMLFATRGKGIDIRVWRAHDRLNFPMNQKRVKFDAVGLEVAEAYNQLFETASSHPTCKKWPWILTTEEDNTFEPEAFKKLLRAIRHCPDCKVAIGNADHCPDGHKSYDGIAGLYWTKTEPPAPMVFGDPARPRDFTTRSIRQYKEAAHELDQVVECNSIPMGFTLFRNDLALKLPKPWFKTAGPEQDDAEETRGAIGQDVWFCLNAKENAGARFAVHCGVKVGHIDPKTGQVF